MLDFNGTVFRPTFIGHLGPKVMKALMKKELPLSVEETMKQHLEVRIPAVLSLFDDMLKRAGTTFICGNEPSIADFQLFAEFLDVHYCHLTFDEYTNIKQWHDACRQVPGLKEVHEEWDAALEDINQQLGF